MARKDPFKRIMVYERILQALEKRRREEFKDSYKVPPMNEYCEAILWDYATGKLTRSPERGEWTPEEIAEHQKKMDELQQQFEDEDQKARPPNKRTA